ncbi:MAG: putative metalloprotease CJM1_0395 family protein [Pseudomonadota bacterium]
MYNVINSLLNTQNANPVTGIHGIDSPYSQQVISGYSDPFEIYRQWHLAMNPNADMNSSDMRNSVEAKDFSSIFSLAPEAYLSNAENNASSPFLNLPKTELWPGSSFAAASVFDQSPSDNRETNVGSQNEQSVYSPFTMANGEEKKDDTVNDDANAASSSQSKPFGDISGTENSTDGANKKDKADESAKDEKIQELKARHDEVVAHEEAHASVGGQYAGSPSYTYVTGPDGKGYAVGGSVPIDMSEIPDDPEGTYDKMMIVEAAALAPSEPSTTDIAVAGAARSLASKALMDMWERDNKTENDKNAKADKNEGQTNSATTSSDSTSEGDATPIIAQNNRGGQGLGAVREGFSVFGEPIFG